jgi:hypothetical protein
MRYSTVVLYLIPSCMHVVCTLWRPAEAGAVGEQHMPAHAATREKALLTVDGYCSHCTNQSTHHFVGVCQVKGWVFTSTRRVHQCGSCGRRTLPCTNKGCQHMVRGDESDSGQDESRCVQCLGQHTFGRARIAGDSLRSWAPPAAGRALGPCAPAMEERVSSVGEYDWRKQAHSDDTHLVRQTQQFSVPSPDPLRRSGGSGGGGSSRVRVGDEVEIYSKSSQAWLPARVLVVCFDESLGEEVAQVSYTSLDGREMEKALRTTDIRANSDAQLSSPDIGRRVSYSTAGTGRARPPPPRPPGASSSSSRRGRSTMSV